MAPNFGLNVWFTAPLTAELESFHFMGVHCAWCRNEMTARTINKYEGYNICDRCHDNIYKTKVKTLTKTMTKTKQ